MSVTRGTITTPCQRVCRVDMNRGTCIGCGRGLDEIRDWYILSEEERKAKMNEITKSRPTIVWSKPDCPYCVQAKDLLNSKGIRYEERVLGDGWTKEQLLEEIPNVTTVPQIVMHGQHVGGYIQLLQYFEDHGMWTNG